MTAPSTRTYTYHDSKKCHTMTTRNLSEPPRSTAYYYADLERLKRDDQSQPRKTDQSEPADELSEYVEANDVINDGPIREVPPLRDRSWTDSRKGETYSTAGTFPMPETKEKEPLLAELEVVGRLPLTQLDGTGVRRSRSWFCCPDVEEEISRESSWRYSSLRPVTAPPAPGQNGLSGILVSSSSRPEDVSTLKAERDALARALAGERARAAEAARAHDARLAELHGVIAELVRRRAADKHARAIPEEELDECESTTQPAGELDNDADVSRTEQNDSSSILSPEELTPHEDAHAPPVDIRVEARPPSARECACDTSLDLSERDSEICLSTGRCCQHARGAGSGGSCERARGAGSGGSCDRERGSSDAPRVFTASPGRCESRQAKLASRVKLRRADDADTITHSPALNNHDESWCSEAAEQLALEVCAQADLREALLAANNDGAQLSGLLGVSRARCQRLQADVCVLQCALAAAHDAHHTLYCACCVLEQRCVSLCAALRAADRALETYDVLLALAETRARDERSSAELVARQLVAALDAEQGPPTAIGGPLLSPGPWLQHDHQTPVEEWSAESEARLRSHAARLKADTVSLRPADTPALFSVHDIEESETELSRGALRMQDMEAAVMMQEVLEAREAAAARALHAHKHACTHADKDKDKDKEHKKASRGRGRRPWLERGSETDL